MARPADLPFPPVTVETSTIGRLRVVSSVRAAAEMLVHEWPAEKRGKPYRMACLAVVTALTGEGDTASARAAFILAAKESGLFVREGDGRR